MSARRRLANAMATAATSATVVGSKLEDFLFKRFKPRRLAARPSSSGQIENHARQRQAGCFSKPDVGMANKRIRTNEQVP